jgi:hypothetical protein
MQDSFLRLKWSSCFVFAMVFLWLCFRFVKVKRIGDGPVSLLDKSRLVWRRQVRRCPAISDWRRSVVAFTLGASIALRGVLYVLGRCYQELTVWTVQLACRYYRLFVLPHRAVDLMQDLKKYVDRDRYSTVLAQVHCHIPYHMADNQHTCLSEVRYTHGITAEPAFHCFFLVLFHIVFRQSLIGRTLVTVVEWSSWMLIHWCNLYLIDHIDQDSSSWLMSARSGAKRCVGNRVPP